mmetsp:Transcript_152793/g.292636  ORF Transcript_152793/g.292636 Transcript_152793/m.292636 type:complete len:87 (-) Transcript_152793:1125-1385(-)
MIPSQASVGDPPPGSLSPLPRGSPTLRSHVSRKIAKEIPSCMLADTILFSFPRTREKATDQLMLERAPVAGASFAVMESTKTVQTP